MTDSSSLLSSQGAMLRLGLITSAVSVDDCVRYADAVIAKHQNIPDWILEVSLAASMSRADVVLLLPRCGNQVTAEDVVGLYLGWLSRSLRTKRVSVAEASSFMSQLLNDPSADAHRDLICYLVDERELAHHGVAQTPVFRLASLFEDRLAPFEANPALADLLEALEAQ